MTSTDTIVARATPPGRGGIGIVRVSGSRAPEIAQALLGSLPAPRHATLGAFRDALGTVWPGFGLLALTAAGMWTVNARVFLPRQLAAEQAAPALPSRLADRLRASAWATMATGLLVAAIVVGSRNLQNFDPALVIYTFAVIFALAAPATWEYLLFLETQYTASMAISYQWAFLTYFIFFAVLPVKHRGLLSDRRTLDMIASFLEHGYFTAAETRHPLLAP